MKKILQKYAVYKYSSGANKNIRGLSREFGNNSGNAKTRMYKRFIRNAFERQSFGQPLYRGITGKNRNYFETAKNKVAKPAFSSFTRNLNVAKGFANDYRFSNKYILVLNNPKKIPAINVKTSYLPHEQEVILPHGMFFIKNKKINGKYTYIYVNFKSPIRVKNASRYKYGLSTYKKYSR